jgi:hypothetical protein
MDRMSFIPGKKEREYFHNAEGHIFFGRAAAADLADEFIGFDPEYAVLRMQVAHCLADDDEVDIWFGLRDNPEGGEEYPGGELPGWTWATITRGRTGEKKTVLDVGRPTEPTPQIYAIGAFNAYRRALAAHQGVAPPTPIPLPADHADGQSGARHPSRALAPSNLYFGSSVMWYFVDISSIMPFEAEEPTLTRPMNAADALMMTVLLTICIGWAPRVYAVYQSVLPLGQMPTLFRRASFVDAIDPELQEGEIAIIC